MSVVTSAPSTQDGRFLSIGSLTRSPKKITILGWVDGMYEEQIYQGDVEIVSPVFPSLILSAATVLAAGI